MGGNYLGEMVLRAISWGIIVRVAIVQGELSQSSVVTFIINKSGGVCLVQRHNLALDGTLLKPITQPKKVVLKSTNV